MPTIPDRPFRILGLAFAGLGACAALEAAAPEALPDRTPADHLPPHIRRLTWFGERADWSHDGRRILFIEKTYGDAFEVEVATGIVRPVTHHFYHGGFTRALYLANGDLLLSGSRAFDAGNPHVNRSEKAELWVLDKSLTRPPVALGTKCSEGPAVSRRRLHLAWTHVSGQYPDRLPAGVSQIHEADLVYENGVPRLANERLVLDSRTLPFRCTLETQNFVPPAETWLTFSAYGHQGTDVCGVELTSGRVTNYSSAPGQYDEPEGVFPDGGATLVESDRQNRKGSGFVDLWKLPLDGSGAMERLTHFSDHAGYKASNPVVSDDGRFIAFQMAKSRDPAGVGYGIFVLDLSAAPTAATPAPAYLFTYFVGNGEDGLHLAWSRDGYRWEALNGGRSFLKPRVGESKLMRDPCLLRTEGGLFHLVWTTAWQGKTIGHASSRDLVQWSEQQAIPVMAHEPEARNCWAPEVAWDASRQRFLLFWATTIPGRFPETAGTGDQQNNHRIYCTTTQDFVTFTPTRLFYDPGFNVIDATLFQAGDRFHLIVKNETLQPVCKHLRRASARDIEGPFTDLSPPFTLSWVEGPSALRVGGATLVFFDAYRDHHYGAVRSRDLKTWEDVTAQTAFPPGMRHGTALEVPAELVERLRQLPAAPPAGAGAEP